MIKGMISRRPPEDFEILNKNKNANDGQFGSDNNREQKQSSEVNNVNNMNISEKLKQKRLLYSTGVRYTKCIRNDLENIPITLLCAWGSLYANANDKITTYCISIFTVSRLLHGYCYVKALQPYRTISYLSGVLSTFIMVINLVYSVFKQKNKSK